MALLFAGNARADFFQIRPIEFVNDPGYRMFASGTITTLPGTSTITDWSLSVTTVELLAHYTSANTANLSTGPFLVDGIQLRVPTSPDGISDGSSLFFRSRNPLRDFGVAVANFAASGTTGGEAFYMADSSFDFLPLSQPDGTEFVVAHSASAGDRTFTLEPQTFPGGAVMSGTLWTNGRTGTLAPEDVTRWDITVEQITQDLFVPGNSQLLASQLQFDPASPALTVDNPDGYLAFSKGRIGFHPYLLQLSDFPDSSPRGGQAAYFQGRLSSWVIPLGAPDGPWSVTGSETIVAAPESSAGMGFLVSFFAVASVRRWRRP